MPDMPGGIDEIGTVVERVTLIMNASYDVCIYREGKQEMFVRVVGSGANLRVVPASFVCWRFGGHYTDGGGVASRKTRSASRD